MYYSKILFLLLFLGLISCDTIFSKKQETTEKTVLKPIDFNSIDAYPLLPECKEISSRIQQEQCFYTMLSKRIQESINKTPILLDSVSKGTIMVKLQVSELGKITISSIVTSDKIRQNSIKLDSLLRVSVVNIPKITPATKMGIPVTSEFTLPIIIEQEN